MCKIADWVVHHYHRQQSCHHVIHRGKGRKLLSKAFNNNKNLKPSARAFTYSKPKMCMFILCFHVLCLVLHANTFKILDFFPSLDSKMYAYFWSPLPTLFIHESLVFAWKRDKILFSPSFCPLLASSQRCPSILKRKRKKTCQGCEGFDKKYLMIFYVMDFGLRVTSNLVYMGRRFISVLSW